MIRISRIPAYTFGVSWKRCACWTIAAESRRQVHDFRSHQISPRDAGAHGDRIKDSRPCRRYDEVDQCPERPEAEVYSSIDILLRDGSDRVERQGMM